MESKIYTANELRDAADFFVRNAERVRRKVLSNEIIANIHDLIPMLRYAAEIVERCEKMILPCDFDGAPCVPSDAGNCTSCDIPTHNTAVNYILRGDAGEGQRKQVKKGD